ncbi:hypothetical protein SAMN02746066_04536 [Anaerosporobacter mobilis DSM 15930]|jgi:vacuolar-type H+-ATPase subunit I/STV1|uniref:Uncharacterized protein n=1 Tax=Anaerosporobacter mobilis DSM 15930 TaxID=1120996 RepID=A0A1M7NJ79_9FIRM|nr:hypothetical protein [Anaerosporobacter mobilis]SHN03737.1 hypothetical protein SAMN02746066_04536 [Anaerosporobacter mobilis DSM 15930]
MTLNKSILKQYIDLKDELKEVEGYIQKLQGQIQRIEDERYVVDSVKGGSGGIQTFLVAGFPYPEYSRKKTRLYMRIERQKRLVDEIDNTINDVEEYISNIQDSRMRRILRHRYIEDMNWIKMAHVMGGKCTSESLRKEHDRFLEKEI